LAGERDPVRLRPFRALGQKSGPFNSIRFHLLYPQAMGKINRLPYPFSFESLRKDYLAMSNRRVGLRSPCSLTQPTVRGRHNGIKVL